MVFVFAVAVLQPEDKFHVVFGCTACNSIMVFSSLKDEREQCEDTFLSDAASQPSKWYFWRCLNDGQAADCCLVALYLLYLALNLMIVFLLYLHSSTLLRKHFEASRQGYSLWGVLGYLFKFVAWRRILIAWSRFFSWKTIGNHSLSAVTVFVFKNHQLQVWEHSRLSSLFGASLHKKFMSNSCHKFVRSETQKRHFPCLPADLARLRHFKCL